MLDDREHSVDREQLSVMHVVAAVTAAADVAVVFVEVERPLEAQWQLVCSLVVTMTMVMMSMFSQRQCLTWSQRRVQLWMACQS